MPISYKVGDLCLAAIGGQVNVIAHQANCFCTMKSGVAKCIAERFPDAVVADNMTTPGATSKLGKWTLGLGKNCFGQSIWIFNLYGQYNFGDKSNGPYTNHHELRRAIAKYGRSIQLP